MKIDGDAAYIVVINDEEQYSIWRSDTPLPAGWRDAGRRGTKDECLDAIREWWKDMRPLSARRSVAAASSNLEVE